MSFGITNTNNVPYPVKPQDNFGALSPVAQETVNKTQNVLKETAEDNWMTSTLKSFGLVFNDPKKLIAAVATSVLIIFGFSHLINRGGIAKEGLFKLGRNLDNIGSSKIFKNIGDFFSGIKNTIKKPFKNSKFTQLFKKGNEANWVSAKWNAAKQMLRGTWGEAVDTVTDSLKAMDIDDAVSGSLEKIVKVKGKTPKALANSATGVISKLKKLYKSNPDNFINRPEVINYLKKATNLTDPKEIESFASLFKQSQKLRETLVKITNGDNVDDLIAGVKALAKDDSLKFEKFEDIYSRMIKNFTKDGVLDVDGLRNFLSTNGEIGKIIQRTPGGALTAQTVNMANALKKVVILKGDGAKTWLGKGVQKLLLRGVEAITNGVTSRAGFGLLSGTIIYTGVMNKTFSAPKNERISKFAEEAVGDAGSYMLIPVAGGFLYKSATLKYLGSSNEQIRAFKNAFKDISEKVAKKQITKAEASTAYKAAKKALSKDVSFIYKPIRKLAGILSAGIETNPGKNVITKGISRFSGGLSRAILIGIVLSPILIKPIMKVCHKIFGTPSDSDYADKKNESEKNKVNEITNTSATGAPTSNSSTNYLDMYKNIQSGAQQPQITTPTSGSQPIIKQATPTQQPLVSSATPVNGAIPAKKINDEKKTKDDSSSGENRSYVPSSVPTEFPETPTEAEAQAQALIKKAESIENDILKKL